MKRRISGLISVAVGGFMIGHGMFLLCEGAGWIWTGLCCVAIGVATSD
jgi:hypothetical protein